LSQSSPLERLPEVRTALVDAIGQVVVGQRDVVELMLVALLSDGHCLFVGVPGLAKTLLVHTVAEAVGVQFGRVQFTPDLMPSDITGVEVLEEDPETRRRASRFVPGPVFANLLLADEINRTPPKTQAALLQAMQERVVTAAGHTHTLPKPFLVFATQNPIEQEGTYPLPEAQQDRFMFSIPVGYPSPEEEGEIVRRTTVGAMAAAPRVLSVEDLLAYQAALRQVRPAPEVVDYAVRLASATRPGSGSRASRFIRWGAGPRASQFLAIGARTRRYLLADAPRPGGAKDDVRAVASAVLRHRVVLSFEAEAEGLTVDRVIQDLLEEVG
jgi:MoxR-like ATPase